MRWFKHVAGLNIITGISERSLHIIMQYLTTTIIIINQQINWNEENTFKTVNNINGNIIMMAIFFYYYYYVAWTLMLVEK